LLVKLKQEVTLSSSVSSKQTSPYMILVAYGKRF